MSTEADQPGPIETSLTDTKESYLKLVAGGETFANAVGTIVPGVGLIGILLGQVLDRRVANVWDIARMLDRVLEEEGERVDQEFLKTREAAAFVEDILTASARLSEEQKRAYYASAFVNGVVDSRPNADTRNRMIDVLERLRMPALQLLAAARGNNDFDIPYGVPVDLTAPNGVLEHLSPGVRLDRLVLDLQDLRRAGLMEVEPILGSEMPGYSKFITTFGLEFDLFVRSPYNDVHPPPQPREPPAKA